MNETEPGKRQWPLFAFFLFISVVLLLCVGQMAIGIAPRWQVAADMRSKLEPNSDFLTRQTSGLIEPVNEDILTLPAWLNPLFPTDAAQPVFTRSAETQAPTRQPTQQPTSVSTLPAATSTGYVPPPPPRKTQPPPPSPTNPPSAPSADLAIAKTDNSATYTPGTGIIYQITVTNAGPDNASGFNIVDPLPAAINPLPVNVNCTTNGTANCGTNNTSGNNVLFSGASINAGAGNQITITVTGTVQAGANGNLANTATLVIPGGAGFHDPNPSNNTATDVDAPVFVADLSITKDDGSATYTPGSPISYQIVVTNNGPANAVDFDIVDSVTDEIAGLTVNCAASGSATCGTDNRSGNNILFNNASIDAGAGNQIRITISGTVDSGMAGTLSNTAVINLPAAYSDPNPADNSATDLDSSTNEPDIGDPDGNWYDVPASPGSYLIVDLGPGNINYNGSLDGGAYDLVYFERYYFGNVELDCVQVEIGPASTGPWFGIFHWCDSTPDANTNVDINVIGGSEDDNRKFPPGTLYGTSPYDTGITIDIHQPLFDAGAASGIYRYLKISQPWSGGGSDGPDIDSIFICPAGGC